MTRLHFAIPGDLAANTGGYAYDRRMIAELAALGHDVAHVPLPEGFPFPDTAERARAADLIAGIADGETVMMDGLAFGALPEIAEREGGRLNLIALVHHPLALETGLDAARAEALRASETRALAAARAVVATSPHTARLLERDFGVAAQRIVVAPPGTDPAARSTGSQPPLVLSVGTLTPRKGHDLLISALTRLTHMDWRCRIVGSMSRDRTHAASLERMIRDAGLEGRIVLAGEVANVRAEMTAADLFALASHYEGYGMVFAEAMAQGVPVVGMRAGAVPDVVPEDAGLLVSPGDGAALAEALGSLIEDPPLRARMADAAFAAGRELPDWAGSARRIADLLEGLAR